MRTPSPRPDRCETCDEAKPLRQDADHLYYTGDSAWNCDDCWQTLAEHAHERSLESFYGASTPQTDRERAEVRRRDR